MPQQLDLIPRPHHELRPAVGQTQPRLWVRRLVVWREPGRVVREVALRPGLNIVWSPDPSDVPGEGQRAGPLGHGSGKTMFCRMLRYCLGEDRFAPEDQRQRVASAFNDGLVGAEIVVDGEVWAVVRAIGNRRHYSAVRGGNLETLANFEVAPTGIEPLLDAIVQRVLTPEVARLVGGAAPHRAWLTALAWLTRDQECRFGHVMDWRAATSGSDSPVRDRDVSRTDLVDAVRGLLGAIAPEEQDARERVERADRHRDQTEQELRHWTWAARRLRGDLARDLGIAESSLAPGRMALDALERAAKAALGLEARVDPQLDALDLPALRQQAREADQRAGALDRQRAIVHAQIPEVEGLLSKLRGEVPGLSYAEFEAECPVCPVCVVPIDRVLAQSCPLPVIRLPDLESVRARHARLQGHLEDETRRLEALTSQAGRLDAEADAARKDADALGERARSLTEAREALGATRSAAWRRLDDVRRLGQAIDEEDRARTALHRANAALEDAREQVKTLRATRAEVFGRLSRHFDYIVRELAGADAQGAAALTGRGVELTVDMSGTRSTPAIDSLKVLAFDLAALMLAIEGAAAIPAFLLHDSPREADMGLSAYHPLFQLVRALEEVGGQPLFQYIITTTTRPPAELRAEPWLRLTLRGAPGKERFLGTDL